MRWPLVWHTDCERMEGNAWPGRWQARSAQTREPPHISIKTKRIKVLIVGRSITSLYCHRLVCVQHEWSTGRTITSFYLYSFLWYVRPVMDHSLIWTHHALNELGRAHCQRQGHFVACASHKLIPLVCPAGEYAHTVLPNHCVWRNALLATKECMHCNSVNTRNAERLPLSHFPFLLFLYFFYYWPAICRLGR